MKGGGEADGYKWEYRMRGWGGYGNDIKGEVSKGEMRRKKKERGRYKRGRGEEEGGKKPKGGNKQNPQLFYSLEMITVV